MKSTFIIIIIGAFALALLLCPCTWCKEKPKKPQEKPDFVSSVEKIARGRTFQDQHVRNVSFTLSPVRAFIKISF